MTSDKIEQRKRDFILIDNSAIYNELRSSVVSSDNWKLNSSGAECDLTTATKSVKAVAHIGPEPGAEGRLRDSVRDEWRAKAGEYLLRLDDLNADILDAVFAIFIERCARPDQMVVIQANDFLRFRGLQPRARGYWTRQKQEISYRVALLSNTWINLREAEAYVTNPNGDREKLRKLRSRAIVVSSVAEEESSEGCSTYAWRMRPGDIFLPMLTSRSGKQLALMSKKVLAYDYYRHSWEKRCARYFTWLHRIRQRNGEYLKGIRVASLLSAIRKTVGKSDPLKTKVRLESALNRLSEDGIIQAWQYSGSDVEILGRHGWVYDWLEWRVVVEPIQEVLEQYERIALGPSPKDIAPSELQLGDAIARIKSWRLDNNLTQLQTAERLGISPNYYAMLERGARVPSNRLLATITEHMQGEPNH